MAPFHELPIDVLPSILAQLSDRRDWHSAALVSKIFHRLATPFLYRTLDSRIISRTFIHHPCTTLLARPELARYVRHVTETGTIHRGMLVRYPNITQDALAALALCTNLYSITWIDDSMTSADTLLAFIGVVRKLPLRALSIRTHSDLGEAVWAQLATLGGLVKVSLWCMEGPPRVLQGGWAGILGRSLTHLELGRCAGVPPSILISVLAQLPLLQDLRLKGAPAASIPAILAQLPNLQSLDTEYLLSASGAYSRPYRPPRADTQRAGGYTSSNSNSGDDDGSDDGFPALRHLTVRTSSMDTLGPQKLWTWIRDELVPRAGLQTFRLHAYTYAAVYRGVGRRGLDLALRGAGGGGGGVSVPRRFLLDMAARHGATLRAFVVSEAQLTLADVQCACTLFGRLEVLGCALACPDVDSIMDAIAPAKHLHTIKLQVQWIPPDDDDDDAAAAAAADSSDSDAYEKAPYPAPRGEAFALADARRMMQQSRLRVVSVGHVQYMGKWVLRDTLGNGECDEGEYEGDKNADEGGDGVGSALAFVVSAGLAEDRWKT